MKLTPSTIPELLARAEGSSVLDSALREAESLVASLEALRSLAPSAPDEMPAVAEAAARRAAYLDEPLRHARALAKLIEGRRESAQRFSGLLRHALEAPREPRELAEGSCAAYFFDGRDARERALDPAPDFFHISAAGSPRFPHAEAERSYAYAALLRWVDGTPVAQSFCLRLDACEADQTGTPVPVNLAGLTVHA
jgi:hypothetical protein